MRRRGTDPSQGKYVLIFGKVEFEALVGYSRRNVQGAVRFS